MKLSPGDRVLITQNGWAHHDDIYFWLVAIKGSTARVISIEEYCEYLISPRSCSFDEPTELVKQWIDEGYQYPVRFETVVKPDRTTDETVTCQVGSVTVLDERFLQMMKTD